MGIDALINPFPDSQIAQDVLEQAEMIFQDVRKNAVQAYIKYKAYYDTKANASKLKQADYVYILQPKADHQRSKIPFTVFLWIWPYIFEKVLPNTKYLVRKIGTNKAQILHQMRLRQFKPANLYQAYQPHRANGNQTGKLPLNMMIYTPEHGSVNMTSQYSIAITMIWQHLIHPKSQSDLKKPLMKWGALRELYEGITHKISLRQTDRMTEWIRITTCSLMRILV